MGFIEKKLEQYTKDNGDKAATMGVVKFKDVWSKNKAALIGGEIGFFALTASAIGSLGTWAHNEPFGIKSFYYGVTGYFPFVFLATTAISLYLTKRYVYSFLAANQKNWTYDPTTGMTISKSKNHGGSEMMGEAEKNKTLIIEDVVDLKANIMGFSPDEKSDKVVGVKTGYGINSNILGVGISGCGKTRCLVIPMIMQCVRRGESFFANDLKGELYALFYYLCKAHGYEVKHLDFRTDFLQYSDSINILKYVKDEVGAQKFATTFIRNCDSDYSFWPKQAKSFLAFAILYVMDSEINPGLYPRSIEGVHKFILSYNREQFDAIITEVDKESPAGISVSAYAASSPQVKESILSNLKNDMEFFASKILYKVCSVDDADFLRPCQKKCAYFLSFDDTENPYQPLTATITDQIFSQIMNHAKKQRNNRLPIITNMILDEFFVAGVIPKFENKISITRGYGINVAVFFQSLAQLKIMFPGDLDHAVQSNFAQIICMQSNDNVTAEWFQKRAGKTTVVDMSERYEERVARIIRTNPEFSQSVSEGSADLLPLDRIYKMDINHLLLVVTTHNVVELRKYDYMRHPMAKEILEYNTMWHCGKWLAECTDNDLRNYKILSKLEEAMFRADVPEKNWYRCSKEDYVRPMQYTVNFDDSFAEIRSIKRYKGEAYPDFPTGGNSPKYIDMGEDDGMDDLLKKSRSRRPS